MSDKISLKELEVELIDYEEGDILIIPVRGACFGDTIKNPLNRIASRLSEAIANRKVLVVDGDIVDVKGIRIIRKKKGGT